MFKILKDYLKIILLFLSLIVVMFILMMSFSLSLSKSYEAEAQKSFYSDSQKSAEILHSILKNDAQNLKLISANIAYQGIDNSDDLRNHLAGYIKFGIIDSAVVINKDGTTLSTNGKIYNLADKEGFKKAINLENIDEDGNLIIADESFLNDGSMSIQFYCPIIKNNEVIAVLATEIPQTHMQEHFQSKTLEQANDITIIDESGTIICSKIISYSKINHFEQIAYYKTKNNLTIDDCLKETASENNFDISYTFNNEDYYNCYHKIGISGLYLVSNTKMSNINTIAKSTDSIELSLIIKLFVTIIIFTILVMNLQTRTIKQIQKSERNMETLTRNIPGGVLRRTNKKNSIITYMSEGFYNLTEFTEYEFTHVFNNEYANIILDIDRFDTLASLDRQLKSGNCFVVEYRLNKIETQWVLEHGQIVQGENGEEIIYSVIVDITDSKVFQQKLEISEQRYQAIIEKTDTVVYEWDINSDTISVSDIWLKRFGYRPEPTGFMAGLEKSKIIYSEDIPKYREIIEHIKEGLSYGEIVIRVRKLSKEYVWCRICLMSIYDATNKPITAIGIIMDVDKEKRETESMQIMAEQDMLTKLYNKVTTQRLIQEYLKACEPSELNAFMIIDIDNFKGVNDNLGHMFGDAVLADVASKIKKIFRSTDIVGRIGGDEFAVFMKNASGMKIIEDKVNLLCAAFRQTFSGTNSDYKISGSIGISIFAKDADNYNDLFKMADKALYHAKSHGKDKYCFYESEMLNEVVSQSALQRITRIDSSVSSDSIDHSFTNNIERYVMEMINDTLDVNSMVNMILSLLGKHYNVSRVAIFENNIDCTHSANTYEWCNEGVPSLKDQLTDIRYADFPAYFDEYNADGVLYCSDIKNLSTKLYKTFDKFNIKSVLYISIRIKGVHKGLIGFETINEQRLWKKDEIETLFFVSKILGSFVIKDRYRTSLLDTTDNQEAMLNALNTFAFVLDADTHKVLFTNKKLDESPLKINIGDICFENFSKNSSESMLSNISESTEIYVDYADMWVNFSASEIEWKECKNPLLIIGNDITKYKNNSEK